jgi:HEAT repeat protein
MKKILIFLVSILIIVPACKKEEPADAAKEEEVARVEEKDPIKANIMLLDSEILLERRDAMEALRVVGEAAIDPLLDAFSDGSDVLQGNAMTLIEELDPDWFKRESAKKSVPYFLKNLASEDPDKRDAANNSLELIGDPAMEQLVTALRGESRHIAEGVVHIIMAIDPYWMETELGMRVIPDFIAALKDKSPNVKRNASHALIKMGHAAFDKLIPALLDEDIQFQKRVKWILSEVEAGWETSEQALKFLPDFVAGIKSEYESIRLISIEILGKMKDERAIEPLIFALNDDFLYARKSAESSLVSITGKNFGESQGKWLKWLKEKKAKAAKKDQ